LVDTVAAAIIKRQSSGRSDGVAVLAEGLVEFLDQQDLEGLEDVERDQHGHVRLGEINFGFVLKRAVEKALRSLGVKTTIVDKNIGYELRCADPISFDMEYTRDLGYCAAQFLLEGGNAAMVSIQNGRFIPIPFDRILDPATGRTKVRMVDVESESYVIARRYMIRLSSDDLSQTNDLSNMASTVGLTPDAFRERFGYLLAQNQ
jgi:6-phosphofructokinase 1